MALPKIDSRFQTTAHYKAAINQQGLLSVIDDLQSAYAIGMKLPFTPTIGDPIGFNLAWTTNEAIQADIINLILTQKGERLGNPDFGTNLHALLFDPSTSELETKVKEEIENALKEYTGRIGVKVHNISTERKDTAGNISNTLKVGIKYSLFGEIDELTIDLFGGPGPKFASYKTTKPELAGTTLNEIEWLETGGTLGW
jgi:phage baseplate assembly protein W